jgi:hypothetical protein
VTAKNTTVVMPGYPLTLTARGAGALSETCEVTIIVRDENGNPLENVTVTLGGHTGTTGPDGSVTLDMPPGSYDLELVKQPDVDYKGYLEVDTDVTAVITLSISSPAGGHLYSKFSHDNGVWVDNDDLHGVYNQARGTLSTDDTTGLTARDFENYEDGGDITIYLVAADVGSDQIDERNRIQAMIKADGKGGSFVLDLSAYKSSVDKHGSSVYNEIKLRELNGLVKVHILLKPEHRGHSGYAVYRHHEGNIERIPQKPGRNSDGEYFEISDDGTEIILYVKKFSVYAVAYDVTDDGSGGPDVPNDPDGPGGPGGPDIPINISVNNRPVERDGNDFSAFTVCGEDNVAIRVTIPGYPTAAVVINGVAQNPHTVNLPNYGDNRLTITVRLPNNNERSYTLTINKRVPWAQLVVMRSNNTLSIINNPANNGGYNFSAYRWYRGGQEFSRAQWWSAGAQGELLNTTFEYEAEGITANGMSLRTCPTLITLRDME